MVIRPLSGQDNGSFAYVTIKDRLPVIITTIIDHLCREKVVLCNKYGEGVQEDVKNVIGGLSKLKSNLQTNKPLASVDEIKDPNNAKWNAKILEFKNLTGNDPKWFTATWLFVECFMYKYIQDIFINSEYLNKYDQFGEQKRLSFENSVESINLLSQLLNGETERWSPNADFESKKTFIRSILEFSLWGNQYDLSFSSGLAINTEGNHSLDLPDSSQFILADEFEGFWAHLKSIKARNNRSHRLAIILDNAGFELVSDLCLAFVLTELRIFESVTFYVKASPWFVSDTTLEDLHWTLNRLKEVPSSFAKYGNTFAKYFENGVWETALRSFWTLPHDFNEMKSADPALYKELSQFSLLVFKGDLNYRKLVGDLDWPKNKSFKSALRSFCPAPILSLRTLKGGPVVGLDMNCTAVKNAQLKENWVHCGEYGVIQFVAEDECRMKMSLMAVFVMSALIPVVAFFCKRFIRI